MIRVHIRTLLMKLKRERSKHFVFNVDGQLESLDDMFTHTHTVFHERFVMTICVDTDNVII